MNETTAPTTEAPATLDAVLAEGRHEAKGTLLPVTLATLADIAAREPSRYSLVGIHLKTTATGYVAEATDGKLALRVQGQAADRSKYPPLPALDSAPNGVHDTLIPTAAWKQAFRSVPKKTYGKPALASVACVQGEQVTTLATTDLDTQTVLQPRNLDGRFPDMDQVIPGAGDKPESTVTVNVDLLIRLLKAMKDLTTDGRITLKVRGPKHLVSLHCHQGEQESTGVLMPLN